MTPADPQPTRGTFPTTARPGWWSRNWKWFVPTGCFTLLLLALGMIAAFVFLLFGTMKSTDVYRTALARAQANLEVHSALGTPVKAGMFLGGNISTKNGYGTANINIPISGPKGKGTIYAEATKPAGQWVYSTLEVEVPHRKDRINLQPQGSEP